MDREWTASFSIRFRNGTCIIILDKKYNIASSSCHFGSYNIFLVTDRSIYCHMTLSAMNYLLLFSWILELFRQCGFVCFLFHYYMFNDFELN